VAAARSASRGPVRPSAAWTAGDFTDPGIRNAAAPLLQQWNRRRTTARHCDLHANSASAADPESAVDAVRGCQGGGMDTLVTMTAAFALVLSPLVAAALLVRGLRWVSTRMRAGRPPTRARHARPEAAPDDLL
jgi:hypothetical protein